MRCRVCNTSDADAFYKGITNYCKEHWKARVKANRRAKLEQYQAYERQRANLPHRLFARQQYAATPRGQERMTAAKHRWRERNPEKRAAHVIVGNALRCGKLQRQPCEGCGGENVHAHHDDYSKPLEVRWLCPACHAQHHKEAA